MVAILAHCRCLFLSLSLFLSLFPDFPVLFLLDTLFGLDAINGFLPGSSGDWEGGAGRSSQLGGGSDGRRAFCCLLPF